MTLARDIMETSVISVGMEDSVMNTCRLFYEEEISGAPVVSDDGMVVGVVSLTDLVRTAQEEHARLLTGPDYYRDAQTELRPEWQTEIEEFEDSLSRSRVSEVMTREVVSVAPDVELQSVVKKILEHRIHRVLVLDEKADGGNLAGIISLFDLVRLLE